MKNGWIGLVLPLTCVTCDSVHAAQADIVRDAKRATALIDLAGRLGDRIRSIRIVTAP
jgi:hypothetical protein